MLLQLNLTEIIKKRMGKKGALVPSFLLHLLERVICQEELNAMLRFAYPAHGSAFSKKIEEYLDLTIKVEGLDKLPPDEKFIFASNHPLGGLDGIALVGVLGSLYGDENIKVMVNDLLMNVTPLAGVFLPVNKFGKKGARESSRLLNEAIEEGKQILMFPAGLVSRKGDDGSIRDLEWKKTFVAKALESGRRIVPVRFYGENSPRFYNTARWRKKLGVGVNIEQALLPSELCKARGKEFTISFKEAVDPREMEAHDMKPYEIAQKIRETVIGV